MSQPEWEAGTSPQQWDEIRQLMLDVFRRPATIAPDRVYLAVIGHYPARIVRNTVLALADTRDWVPVPVELKRAVDERILTLVADPAPRVTPQRHGRAANDTEREVIQLEFANAPGAKPGEGAADLATEFMRKYADPTMTADDLEADCRQWVDHWVAWLKDDTTRFDYPGEEAQIAAYIRDHGVGNALAHYAPIKRL